MRLHAGVTLIELLVSATMVAIVTLGAASAFRAGIDFQNNVLPKREQVAEQRIFEKQLRTLIGRAFLNPDTTDTTTYFYVGAVDGETGGSDEPADSITFTVRGAAASGGSLESVDAFEQQHEAFGPQGGVTEITLSTTAYGDAGDRTGLFRRVQTPSDGDASQGGFEELWSGDIATIGFEAFDGANWLTEWDTQAIQAGRLPAAIRVTYTFEGDEERPHVLVIRLPLSDVTPSNPAATGGTQ